MIFGGAGLELDQLVEHRIRRVSKLVPVVLICGLKFSGLPSEQ